MQTLSERFDNLCIKIEELTKAGKLPEWWLDSMIELYCTQYETEIERKEKEASLEGA